MSDLLQRVVDEAARLVHAGGALICLVDEATGQLRFAYESGVSDARARAWARAIEVADGSGLIAGAIAERRVRTTDDYLADTSFVHPRQAASLVRRLGVRSLAVAPMLVGDRAIGAIGVYSDRAAAFGDPELALTRALADHAAASIANARLIDELARSRERLVRRVEAERTLSEIASRLAAMRDPVEILQYTVDEACRLVGADGARIDAFAEEGSLPSLRFDYGEVVSGDIEPTRFVGDEVRRGQGASGRALVTGRAAVTGDYLADPTLELAPSQVAFAERTGIRSVASALMPAETGPIAALTVMSRTADAFDDDDVAVISALADHAAIAISNARLIEHLRLHREEITRRADAETTLREIAGELVAIREPGRLLQRVVDEASRLVRADGAILALLDPDRRHLRWSYDDGLSERFDPAYVAELTLDVGVGVTGRAVAEGRAILADRDLIDEFPRTPESLHFFHVSGFKAMIGVPIVGEGGPLGALEVYSRAEGSFGEHDVALLEALAGQAAIALTNARLIEELARSREELGRRAESERTLREMAARLTAIRDPGELLQLVVEEAARLLGAERSQIDLLDATTGLLRWAYSVDGAGPDRAGSLGQPVSVGVAGRAIADERVFVTGDYLADDRFEHEPATDGIVAALGLRSIVAAPLRGDDGLLGVLQIGARRADAFDTADAALLEALANQAAVAITNARLIEALARSRQEVERRARAERALREIGARLTVIRDPGDLLQQAVEAAASLLGGDGALLDLIDPATGLIRWAYDAGIEDDESRQILRRLELPIGVGMFGRAVAERRVLATSDYVADDRFTHDPGADEFAQKVGFRSFVAAPLIAEPGALGVLGVYAGRADAFDEDDIALLGAFADQATVAIMNSRLIDELARSREEIARRAEAERTLREIAARITALRDPGEVLQQVVDESKRLLGSDGAHLTFMSDDRTYLTPVVVAGGTDDGTEAWLKTQEFPLGGGMNGLAAELNRPIWTVDYLVDPRIPHDPDDQEVAERMALRGMAVAPLRAAEGEAIGTLAVSYATPREFGGDELGLLQGLADQAAIAVTNLRLFDRLAQSEARYRFLVQNAPDIVWSLDGEGRWSFISPAIERLGWTHQQLIGRPFWEIVPEDARPELLARWAEAVAADTAEPTRLRSALLTAAGESVAVEIVGNPIVEDGRFVGGYGVTRDVREQDRLERELRESESRYRNLVQTSPDVVWAVDDEGRFTYVSARMEELTGWLPEELVGEQWSALVAPQMVEVAERQWNRLADDPALVLRVPLTLRHRDGSDVATEVSAVSARDDLGFAGAHGSIRDVRERDRLLRQLRESEARFRFLVANSPDIVYETDENGVFTYISDTTERLLGRPAEELIGRHFSVIVAPESMTAASERWAALVADSATVQTVVLELVHSDGHLIPFEVSAIGMDPEGRFAGIHGSSRDISDRELLQRELRESESRFRYLVETSPDVIWQVDETGVFSYLSETAEAIVGWSPDRLVGRHFSTLVAARSTEESQALWGRLIAEVGGVQDARIYLRRPDGSEVPTEVYAISSSYEGRFTGAHGSIRDITERERLERDLRQQAAELASSDERAHLARELHDSVTQGLFSMTLLTRSIELLLEKDPAAAAEKLASLRELQRDALAETRALIFELRPSSLDQDGLVKALRTHAAAVQGRIGLPVVIEADDIGRLPHDVEDALYRIAQEALHNVVKHANARQVRISVGVEPPNVRLVVEDDGIGFDQAAVPSGHLGLAGMRARADKVHGALAVASRKGGGTRIEVAVPIGEPAPADAGPEAPSSAE